MVRIFRKYMSSPLLGWFSVIAAAGWKVLEHYEKVERILPLPPWFLFAFGILWVILAKRPNAAVPANAEPQVSEVILRERTTTTEREIIVRRNS